MTCIIDVFKEAMQDVKAAQAYPIEARRRQKARAKAGHIPKKKPQVVEQQFDDCGENFSGLKGNDDQNINLVSADVEQPDRDEDYFFMNLTHHFGLSGCGFEADNPRDMFLGSAMNNMVLDS